MVGSVGSWKVSRRWAALAAVVASVALLACSAAAQAVWTAPANVSPTDGFAALARTVVDRDGVATAIWTRGSIEVSAHAPGGEWSTPRRLSAPGAQAGVSRVVGDPAGTLTAIWWQSDGGQKSLQWATRPRGGDWSQPAPLVVGSGVADPWLAVAPDGTATAAWIEPDLATSYTAIRSSTRPPGGEWSAPVTVSLTTNHAFAPRVVVDANGTATAVWYQSYGSSNVIYASTRPAGGAWSTPQLMSVGDPVSIPRIAVAPDGTVTAAWRATVAGVKSIESADRQAGGAWTTATVVMGGPAAGGHADTPEIAFDGDGNATMVWTRTAADGFNVIQAITRPAGGSWSAPVQLSVGGRNAFEPTVAYAPDGRAVAVWKRRNDVNYIVQAAWRSHDGAWSTPVDLSAYASSSLELGDISIAFDGDGDPIVSWYRSDGVARRIQIAVDDAHGPRLDGLTIPATATVGTPASFSVSPLDAWAALGTTTWEFGDGASAEGPSVSHAYADAGTRTVTVAATDALGLRTETTATATVTRPPVVDPPRVDPPVVDPPRVDPPRADPPAGPPAPRPQPRARATPPTPKPVVCRVPKLAGVTLADAARRLRAAHCKLGRVRYKQGRRGVGRVIGASRRAGTRLAKNAKVDVTVVRRAPRRGARPRAA